MDNLKKVLIYIIIVMMFPKPLKTQKFYINNRDWALEMKMKKPF